ncbi:CLUMA_CG011245, isoform A [Clunio marinus]|uniref:CLUMA_CG011245, isoform A n=1 Tax=Clunio marinus TaxID=568069 RepID=A0A1J1IFR2_9DIPT|nr:CLUMA_CG011245, isoform A [Clunio marinus]
MHFDWESGHLTNFPSQLIRGKVQLKRTKQRNSVQILNGHRKRRSHKELPHFYEFTRTEAQCKLNYCQNFSLTRRG